MTQLRSFLDLTNYYRRFINCYTRIAAPLYAATSGCDTGLIWKEAYSHSFNDFKANLCGAPILAYPRENMTLIIYTDATCIMQVLVVTEDSDKRRLRKKVLRTFSEM